MSHTIRYTLHHIPFLRLLLPFAVGIVWHYYNPSAWAIYIMCSLTLVCGIVGWIAHRRHIHRLQRWAFALATSAAMAGVGMTLCMTHTPRSCELPTSRHATLLVRIDQIPTERTYSYRTLACVVAAYENDSLKDVRIPLLLDLAKSFTASQLKGGDHILIKSDMQPIRNSSMPYSFDYAAYMKRQGILYRQYVADDAWQLSNHRTTPTLRNRAEVVQRQCVAAIERTELSPTNKALLSALLWGYKAELPETMRSYFSTAGLSHVLAVSGLHTGIIAFIVWLLLYPLRFTSLRNLRHIVTIVVLWGYAFITGLSPSVIRACIMATFVATAALINRRNTALNALCGAALLTLLAAPMQLFDIGFQLSYTAVAGILLITPHIDLARLREIHNPIPRYLSGIVAVSIGAQVATLPLAAYYFHYIPVWGLLSNILLVPLLPILVISALTLLLFNALHLPHEWLSHLTDALAHTLTQGAQAIASLPGAEIEGAYLSIPMLILYGIILGSIWIAMSRRTLRPLAVLLSAVIITQAISIALTLQPSNAQAIASSEGGHALLQMSDSRHNCIILTTDTTHTLPRSGEEWRINQRLDAQLIEQHDTIATPHIYATKPFIDYYGLRILWLDDNTWRYTHTAQLMPIEYLIVTEQYKGRIAPLLHNFAPRHIILTESIFASRADELQAECAALEIPCHNSHQDGVWQFPAPTPTHIKSQPLRKSKSIK